MPLDTTCKYCRLWWRGEYESGLAEICPFVTSLISQPEIWAIFYQALRFSVGICEYSCVIIYFGTEWVVLSFTYVYYYTRIVTHVFPMRIDIEAKWTGRARNILEHSWYLSDCMAVPPLYFNAWSSCVETSNLEPHTNVSLCIHRQASLDSSTSHRQSALCRKDGFKGINRNVQKKSRSNCHYQRLQGAWIYFNEICISEKSGVPIIYIFTPFKVHIQQACPQQNGDA